MEKSGRDGALNLTRQKSAGEEVEENPWIQYSFSGYYAYLGFFINIWVCTVYLEEAIEGVFWNME